MIIPNIWEKKMFQTTNQHTLAYFGHKGLIRNAENGSWMKLRTGISDSSTHINIPDFRLSEPTCDENKQMNSHISRLSLGQKKT